MTILAAGHNHAQLGAIAHEAMAVLRKVWTAYTLKRAIAVVASTSERDYRDFGLDKSEILTALRCLRDEVEGGGIPCRGADPFRRRTERPLVISVAKRAPGGPGCSGATARGARIA